MRFASSAEAVAAEGAEIRCHSRSSRGLSSGRASVQRPSYRSNLASSAAAAASESTTATSAGLALAGALAAVGALVAGAGACVLHVGFACRRDYCQSFAALGFKKKKT